MAYKSGIFMAYKSGIFMAYKSGIFMIDVHHDMYINEYLKKKHVRFMNI